MQVNNVESKVHGPHRYSRSSDAFNGVQCPCIRKVHNSNSKFSLALTSFRFQLSSLPTSFKVYNHIIMCENLQTNRNLFDIDRIFQGFHIVIAFLSTNTKMEMSIWAKARQLILCCSHTTVHIDSCSVYLQTLTTTIQSSRNPEWT